jgi:ATP-dependent Clp protease ATP-binding subunit ClpA
MMSVFFGATQQKRTSRSEISLLKGMEKRNMPAEPQQTSMENQYFDVASVLYHTLRGSQTLASYIEDARQGGNQELVQFFQQVKQQEDRSAEQAKQWLAKLAVTSGAR